MKPIWDHGADRFASHASRSLFLGLPYIVTSHFPLITADMFFLAAKRLSQPVLPALQILSFAPIRPQAQPQQRRPPPPAATSSESSSESEEEDSDDDAPLATLVAPRRPGSALSSFSGSNPNLVGSPPSSAPRPRSAARQPLDPQHYDTASDMSRGHKLTPPRAWNHHRWYDARRGASRATHTNTYARRSSSAIPPPTRTTLSPPRRPTPPAHHHP
ncbi:hypothetical protein K438DRAFT_1992797 [Mycena galopus ATCC 62051]|nr:hypothetical protein K438DRAFT_1992797 [Mycena galopus ATCC 62051]